MPGQRKRNPNGAGTIWQRKDGRYEARVYVPQPDGTRKRKTVYGSTWEECDTKRQELVRRGRCPLCASHRCDGTGCDSGRPSRVRALPGRRRAMSSRRGTAVRLSHGTSTGLSRASLPLPGCGWSGCTTPGTGAPRC